jgi:hypothetical protein
MARAACVGGTAQSACGREKRRRARRPPHRSRVPRRACEAVGAESALPHAVPAGVESRRVPRDRRRVRPPRARLPTRSRARRRRRANTYQASTTNVVSCAYTLAMATSTTRRARAGRPATRLRPGEKASDYRRLTMRLPDDSLALLKAIARTVDAPAWRVMVDALRAYVGDAPALSWSFSIPRRCRA